VVYRVLSLNKNFESIKNIYLTIYIDKINLMGMIDIKLFRLVRRREDFDSF
jgi:hypothetical protein